MLPKIEIRSRVGNVLLAAAGVLFGLAAAALLVVAVLESREGASMLDRLIQLALVAAIATSVWFVSVARRNLRAGRSPEAPRHRATAAATR